LHKLFIRDFYLQNGMVPVDGFSPEDIEAFHKRLESLNPEERRKAKRKFRKFVRKLEKKINLSSFDGLDPSPAKKNARRKNVHRHICKSVREKLNG